ncbi:MAG: 3D domain-containing protein [Phycisphaeraceae bacterium]|nr:3D domain-containing protein [Phycisphaeraceae bacterium]
MNFIRTQLQTKRRRLALAGLGAGCFFSVLVWSGVEAFTRTTEPVPLAATESAGNVPSLGDRPAPAIEIEIPTPSYEVVGEVVTPRVVEPVVTDKRTAVTAPGNSIKRDRAGKPIIVDGKPWTGEVFDHKPIRPVKTRTMKTTAYSPDERSCGKWADGITASGKSVWMNGGRLVAADRAIPYGTIMTIPGYNYGKPVQVWDRGGKIKGNRLDLLYPTHEIAMQWGVQDLPVVFWEFVEAD